MPKSVQVFNNLFTYSWANTPYNSNQVPQDGTYKSQLIAQCIQTESTQYQVTIQPNLTLPNTLTDTKLLFQESWDTINSLADGSTFLRLGNGLTLGPGVLGTPIQNLLTTYLTSTLPAPPSQTTYVQKVCVNVDSSDDYIGVVVIYPVSTNPLQKLTSGTVYTIHIIDPTISTFGPTGVSAL